MAAAIAPKAMIGTHRSRTLWLVIRMRAASRLCLRTHRPARGLRRTRNAYNFSNQLGKIVRPDAENVGELERQVCDSANEGERPRADSDVP